MCAHLARNQNIIQHLDHISSHSKRQLETHEKR